MPKTVEELRAEVGREEQRLVQEQQEREQLEQRLAELRHGNGVPLPPSNQTDVALSEDQQFKRRMRTALRSNHLRRTQIDPIDADRAWHLFFEEGWNGHMAERKRMHPQGNQ